jgi:hypothetical protein
MYIILLSGQGGFTKQVTRALTDAGFVVHDSPADHGLPDKVTGGVDPTTGFVSCEGDDPSTAHESVASLNWTLRAHYHPPSQPEPPEDVLRRIVREEIARSAA